MKKLDRKWYIAGGVILVLICGIFWGVTHRKTDVTKDVVVSFKGYNGNGELSYNADTVKRKILNTIGQRQGLSESDIKRVDNASSPSDVTDIYDKALKTKELADMVTVEFSKESKLSNGDKVVLKVTSPGKDVPIKQISKTYTVRGLKKVKIIKTSSISKSINLSFEGFNGIGYVKATSSKFKDMVLKIDNNGHLKNNDQVKATITKESMDELSSNGTKFEGGRSFTVKVKGLKDLNKISNLDAVINLNTEYAKNENKSSDYENQEVELLHTYAKAYEGSDSSSVFSYMDDDSKTDDQEVTLNKSVKNAKKVTIFGLYKVTTKFMDGKPNVKYITYGIQGLSLQSNLLNIDSKNTDDNGITKNYDDTLSIVQQKLSSTAVLLK